MNTKNVILCAIVLSGVYLFARKEKLSDLPPSADSSLSSPITTLSKVIKTAEIVETPKPDIYQTIELKQKESSSANSKLQEDSLESGNSVGYQIEDGVAVVEGDIVLGIPAPGQKYTGFTSGAPAKWPDGTIPFVIKDDVQNPAAVIQAISQFVDTGIKFRPYAGEEDALVFQAGTGNCKSYVGRVGGMQPLWVAPGCGAKEIAHEIMHAIGFIHEQNRDDRDSYIEILWGNIQPYAKVNFEAFPKEASSLNALGPFDFSSIMIYPPYMFSANGGETLRSKNSEKPIAPSQSLSINDILRLNRLSSQ